MDVLNMNQFTDKYHFIRELVEKESVTLKYCSRDDMIADMLTKGLSKDRFHKIRTMTGIRKSPEKRDF